MPRAPDTTKRQVWAGRLVWVIVSAILVGVLASLTPGSAVDWTAAPIGTALVIAFIPASYFGFQWAFRRETASTTGLGSGGWLLFGLVALVAVASLISSYRQGIPLAEFGGRIVGLLFALLIWYWLAGRTANWIRPNDSGE